MTRKHSNAGLFERLRGPSSVSYGPELRRRRAEAKKTARAQAMRDREREREELRREREQIRAANKQKRLMLAEERREELKRRQEEAREAPHKAMPSAAAIQRAYDRGAKSLSEAMEMAKRNPGRGSKGKFQRCVESVAARGTAKDPKAVCGAMEKSLQAKRNAFPGTGSPTGFAKEQGQWFVPSSGMYYSKSEAIKAAKQLANERGQEWQVMGSGRYRSKPGVTVKPSAKRNPAEGAAKAYRDFHGRAPDESVTISRQVHFHRHLAAAGELRRLDGETIEGGKFSLKWGRGEKPILAFNEQRNQLFIEGGKQAVDLPAFGIKSPHELETLGRVTHIDYFARKDHLGDEGGAAIYRHKFRTVNQDGKPVTVKILRFPDLIYRVRDKHLEFSGGSYTIEPEGIDK